MDQSLAMSVLNSKVDEVVKQVAGAGATDDLDWYDFHCHAVYYFFFWILIFVEFSLCSDHADINCC